MHLRSFFLSVSVAVLPLGGQAADTDSLGMHEKAVHRVEVEVLPDLILHTNPFMKGENEQGRTMNNFSSVSLRYAFQQPEGSMESRLFGQPYQGVGITRHFTNNLLGKPVSLYLFQGARIARLSRALSLNYEWKLGLAAGWKTYDQVKNSENRVFGSSVTAYMNAAFYLNYRLSDQIDVNLGASASHFSNGNTRYPNAGLNTVGPRVSLAYYFNRETADNARQDASLPLPPFKHYASFDLLAYGAWCMGGYENEGKMVALHDPRGVFGLCFSPMYHLTPQFAAGLSVDGVYDHSANLTVDLSPINGRVLAVHDGRQFAVGASVRAELLMPYFCINAGIGTNIVNAFGDLSGVYEMLSLKVNVTGRYYLNIGYTLHDFKDPDHLMLGIGYRFGSKYRPIRTIF